MVRKISRGRIFRSLKFLLGGTGAGLGLLSAAGSCGVVCGSSTLLVGSFLGSLGLSAVANWLPSLKIPLLLGSILFALLAVRELWKRGARKAVFIASLLILIGGGVAVAHAFFPQTGGSMNPNGELAKYRPQTLRVLNEGLYELWPKLGRAPSLGEIKEALHLSSKEEVALAFKEIEERAGMEFFDENTGTVKWYWPFSSRDHGVTVTLEGAMPVYARCAIDALGTSAMYGKPARISVKTPIFHKDLLLEIDGKRIGRTSGGVVVGYKKDDCDNMLFFSSIEEFREYQKRNPGSGIELYDLDRALTRGIASFGTKREVLKAYYEGKT